MASSGSFNTSDYGGRYLKFSWSIVSQDVTTNKTVINWELTGAGTADYGYYKAGSFKVVIAGSTVYSSSTRIELYEGTKVASGQKTIYHNVNGTGSFSASVEAAIYYSSVNCTGSGTFTLTTIPRTSSFTVSNISPDMDTAVTFTITRASDAFTHKLTYSFEGRIGTIGTGIAAVKSWTIPLSLASQIPSKTSGTCAIICTTYDGSTEIGTTILTMTLKVPSSVVPTINNVAITEATSDLANKFGAFIQNKSKLNVVISASGVQSSTIKSYSTKILSMTYNSRTFTTGLITHSGSVNVIVTVTDSRDRITTVTRTVNVLAYSDPKIPLFTATRCNNDGTDNDEGEFVKLAYAFEITSLNSKNDKSYSIGYNLTTSDDYTILTSGSLYSVNTTYKPTTVFNADSSYELKLTVTDYFKSVSYIVELSTAFTLMDYHSSGKGMSIGKVAELENTLDVDLIMYPRKGYIMPVLEKGTDLNNVTTPNMYIGNDPTNYGYLHCPVNTMSFTLEVFKSGGGEQYFQRLTACTKTAVIVYMRFYYLDSWGSWLQLQA